MFSVFKAFWEKHRDLIIYFIFGVLTTAVNYAVYYPVYNCTAATAAVSNCIAWSAAVVFAFVTNKIFVFRSKDWHFDGLMRELFKFTACRIVSGILETAMLFLIVDMMHYNGNTLKLLISIIVVILNYFASKLFVFSKKK